MENSIDKTITWVQVSHWMPLMVSAVSIALTFATLDRRLALVEQKIDTLITATTEMSKKYSSVEERYGSLSLRINTIETKLSIK